jgi:hypothetical protein
MCRLVLIRIDLDKDLHVSLNLSVCILFNDLNSHKAVIETCSLFVVLKLSMKNIYGSMKGPSVFPR